MVSCIDAAEAGLVEQGRRRTEDRRTAILPWFFKTLCCGPFLKSLLNLLHYCFCFVLVFWRWGLKDLSSPTRDWNLHPQPPHNGRQSPKHWTAREVPREPPPWMAWPHTVIFPKPSAWHMVETCFGFLDYQNQGPETSGLKQQNLGM